MLFFLKLFMLKLGLIICQPNSFYSYFYCKIKKCTLKLLTPTIASYLARRLLVKVHF